jgi:hypothetical protein
MTKKQRSNLKNGDRVVLRNNNQEGYVMLREVDIKYPSLGVNVLVMFDNKVRKTYNYKSLVLKGV